ncbi:hypothetical protein [Herpetosiphon llansteffanensis]|uniref:hypothetical protein n=1 Tax=Herpetosiphon llansteffanensis TaxID=2094568 RepID=UPI000D7BF11D|nr:hypothetical protein [Herpetosiphon llansteffanensis]
MYNVPHADKPSNWLVLLTDGLTLVVFVVSIIIWILIEDQRWYGIDSKALIGSELAFYQQWHYLKYVELGVALCLAVYSFAKRRSLRLRERIYWLLPVGLLWVYWIQMR